MLYFTKKLLLTCCILPGLLLGGCATLSGPPDPNDPWESFNRSMYSFNDKVDRAVLKPVAKGYHAITPDPVETGVTNFFSNLEEIKILLNNLLQLKPLHALSDTGRLIINSTLGLGGLFDVATPIGLDKHNEDFGQTMGRWGMGSGPYMMLPFFGPSSVRDGAGLIVGYTVDPIREVDNNSTRNGLYLLDTIDTRAQLLAVGDIIDQAALDPYSYVRDGWLQRRRSLIYDGNPPPTEEEIDIFSDDPGSDPADTAE